MNRHLLAATAAALLCVPMIATAAAPAAVPAAPATAAPATLAAHGDIDDTLKAAGQFTILTKALDQTNLTSVLKSPGPLTLIAPTDAAFQALPPDVLANLMKPENAQQLQSLLTYHVINEAVPLDKLQGKKGPIATVNGAKVNMDGSGAQIMFNNADVTATGTATNGSIYVVDKVLMPGGATTPVAATTPPATAATPAAPVSR